MNKQFEQVWDDIASVSVAELPLDDMEPRVQFLLRHYMSLCRPDGILPGRQDIHPADLVPVLPFLQMLDVVPGQHLRFRYRLVGTGLVSQMGRELTGTFVDEQPGGKGVPQAALDAPTAGLPVDRTHSPAPGAGRPQRRHGHRHGRHDRVMRDRPSGFRTASACSEAAFQPPSPVCPRRRRAY